MDFDAALEYVQRARAIMRENGLDLSVAVSDLGGIPIAFARGGGWSGAYVAIGNARLAASFRRPNRTMIDMWQSRPLFAQSIMRLIPGGSTVHLGGYPIVENGKQVGALGVAGGTPEQDDLVARLASGWEGTAGADAEA